MNKYKDKFGKNLERKLNEYDGQAVQGITSILSLNLRIIKMYS